MPKPQTLRQRPLLTFARNFVKHPRMLGAAAPSSPFLVRRLLRHVDWPRVSTLVEYGPGVGTFTSEILRRMPPSASLIAIETNAEFVDVLRRSLPDRRLTVIHGSAADVRRWLEISGHSAADCVISGIPFSTMPEPVIEAVLEATHAALRPQGRFLVYQYSRQVLPHLRRLFGPVHQEVEWRNMVPARVFCCTKATTAVA